LSRASTSYSVCEREAFDGRDVQREDALRTFTRP
jgi:hypothetical protein